MDIKIIDTPISQHDLRKYMMEVLGDFVKVVVDVEKKIMAIGGEMHADEETVLLAHGSAQKDLWGCNIYPDRERDEWLQYSSLINIRPSVGNRSMEIDDEYIQAKVREIVNRLVS